MPFKSQSRFFNFCVVVGFDYNMFMMISIEIIRLEVTHAHDRGQ